MAHDQVSAMDNESGQKENLLSNVQKGWSRTLPAGIGFLKWAFRLDDALKEILNRFQNENRLRKAYRELGEFLYAKRQQRHFDEPDLVELDLLLGEVFQWQMKSGAGRESPKNTERSTRDWGSIGFKKSVRD